jgi:hypothetical protein
MRTPDHPGVDPKCQPRCGAGNTDYAMAFRLSLPFYRRGVRITVGAPWLIAPYNTYYPYCMKPGGSPSPPVSGCVYAPVDFYDFMIVTTDPNAPSRNVIIEEPPVGEKCP